MPALVAVQHVGVAGTIIRALLTIAFPLVMIGFALSLTIGEAIIRPLRVRLRSWRTVKQLAELDHRLLADIVLDPWDIGRIERGEPIVGVTPANAAPANLNDHPPAQAA